MSAGAEPGLGPTPDKPQWMELTFEKSVAADRLRVEGRPKYGPKAGRLEALALPGTAATPTRMPVNEPGPWATA